MAKKRMSTRSWELLEESMLNKHARRFDAILATMDDEEFAKNYIKMLEYVVPKKQRTEVIDDTPAEDRVVLIKYVESEADLENGTESIDGIQEDE